jgi:5-deoxy-D-glucuronate isomerase
MQFTSPQLDGRDYGRRPSAKLQNGRVPSTARLKPQLITPKDVQSSVRGGGNASRQIVDVMPPDFPADKLMVVEVYTPMRQLVELSSAQARHP